MRLTAVHKRERYMHCIAHGGSGEGTCGKCDVRRVGPEDDDRLVESSYVCNMQRRQGHREAEESRGNQARGARPYMGMGRQPGDQVAIDRLVENDLQTLFFQFALNSFRFPHLAG